MPRTTRLLRIRTVVRALALALFLILPVGLFLRLDPLALVSIWSVLLLVATVVWGRWFCGWLCPFGVYHQLTTRTLSRWRRTRWSVSENAAGARAKYYLLVFLLACLVGGWDMVGWIDPLCLMYRGLGVAQAWEVYRSAGAMVPESVFTGLIRDVAASGRAIAPERARLVPWGSFLTLGLLLLATGLNYVRPRLWCRYLCPLGALLGIAAHRPFVRLRLDPDACRSCHLCAQVCPSGAGPEAYGRWKASECFSCRSCQQLCSSRAIRFESSFIKRRK
jgi:polyferredoxin